MGFSARLAVPLFLFVAAMTFDSSLGQFGPWVGPPAFAVNGGKGFNDGLRFEGGEDDDGFGGAAAGAAAGARSGGFGGAAAGAGSGGFGGAAAGARSGGFRGAGAGAGSGAFGGAAAGVGSGAFGGAAAGAGSGAAAGAGSGAFGGAAAGAGSGAFGGAAAGAGSGAATGAGSGAFGGAAAGAGSGAAAGAGSGAFGGAAAGAGSGAFGGAAAGSGGGGFRGGGAKVVTGAIHGAGKGNSTSGPAKGKGNSHATAVAAAGSAVATGGVKHEGKKPVRKPKKMMPTLLTEGFSIKKIFLYFKNMCVNAYLELSSDDCKKSIETCPLIFEANGFSFKSMYQAFISLYTDISEKHDDMIFIEIGILAFLEIILCIIKFIKSTPFGCLIDIAQTFDLVSLLYKILGLIGCDELCVAKGYAYVTSLFV